MAVESIRSMLRRPAAGGVGLVQGWLRTVRHGKEVSFLDVSDGSCMDGLQVVANAETEGFESVVRHLATGSAIQCRRERSSNRPGKGQRFELHATKSESRWRSRARATRSKRSVTASSSCERSRILRPRTNTIGAVFRVRNAASMAIHEFFPARGVPLSAYADRDGPRMPRVLARCFGSRLFSTDEAPRTDAG